MKILSSTAAPFIFLIGLFILTSCNDDDDGGNPPVDTPDPDPDPDGGLFTQGEGVEDIDGNFYPTVVLGEQEWMAANLKTERFKNGDEIPERQGELHIGTNPGWATYGGLSENGELYGFLYNHHAVVASAGLCPEGWRMPVTSDWNQLAEYLGQGEELSFVPPVLGEEQNIGGMLKSTDLWAAPNTGATNESGFAALPGGMMFQAGAYANLSEQSGWWGADFVPGGQGFVRSFALRHDDAGLYRSESFARSGNYVRCLRE